VTFQTNKNSKKKFPKASWLSLGKENHFPKLWIQLDWQIVFNFVEFLSFCFSIFSNHKSFIVKSLVSFLESSFVLFLIVIFFKVLSYLLSPIWFSLFLFVFSFFPQVVVVNYL